MAGRRGLRAAAGPLAATLASVGLLLAYPAILRALGPAEIAGEAREVLRLILGAASYLSAAWLAKRLVGQALSRSTGGRRKPPKVLSDIVSVALFLAAVIAIIALVFDGSALGAAATSGVIVAILGFSLRNVVTDIFAGLALSFERSYRIGDWIEIEGGPSGRVVDINWRTTRVETRDQVQMIVPNGRIAQERLTNYSVPRRQYRRQVELTIDHSIPVAEAKALLAGAAAASPEIRREPAPDVRLVGYEATGLRYAVRYWVPSFAEEVHCRDAVLSAIDEALRGRAVPPPHRHSRLSMVGGEIATS